MFSLIELQHISKAYGNHTVLEDFNLKIAPGEVIGLIGANGSGKSTLLNILSGSEKIHSSGGFKGQILIDGEAVNLLHPQAASRCGIGIVHQELSLFENLDASANIMLTREVLRKGGLIHRKATQQQAAKALNELGIDLPVNRSVNRLPLSYKQFIEIAREVNKQDLRLILMDEPTSSLNPEEVQRLLTAISYMKARGTAVIFVSHRLEEVCAISDRIVVLRDGKTVSHYTQQLTNPKQLALDMIGQDIVKAQRVQSADVKAKQNGESVLLSFDILQADDGHRHYDHLKLDVHKGEIIGITGLAGHGQNIFSDILSANARCQGSVHFKGTSLRIDHVQKTLLSGIAILPEDRKGRSLLLNRSVESNLSFTALHLGQRYLKFPKLKKLSPIDRRLISIEAQQQIDRWHIKCTDAKQKIHELSGGNQQKVCLARAIMTSPELLVIGEPTRGIDLHAKEIILNAILQLNEQEHKTVLITSSELEELRRICDRIVIMTSPELLVIGEPTRGIDLHAKEIILNAILQLNEQENKTVLITSSELEELRRICDRIVIMYEGKIQCILNADASAETFSLAIAGQNTEKESADVY